MFDLDSPLDHQKPVTSRAVSVLFGGVLVLLSALTSAAFFYRFAGDAFAFLVGNLSPWLASLVGVLCFEIASLVWAWLRANDADTAAQIAVSSIAAWLTMGGGLVVTVIYFALTTPLINAQLDSTVETVFSLIGGLLIITGIAGNFAAAHIYRINAFSHAAASQAAELRAMQTSAAHTANRESTHAELVRTLEAIRAELPERSAAAGAQNAERFVEERFTRPTHAQNGRK